MRSEVHPWIRCYAVLLVASWLGRPALAQEAISRGGVGFVAFEGLSVASAERTQISQLTDAGVLTTDGAAALVVTIAGELKAKADKDGVIGVLLVPDVPPFDAAFRNRRALLVSGESAATVAAGDSSYFVSRPQRIDAGFPRYHLLLYNTTGSSATVSVFVNRVR